jgi:hypothetical protein
MPLSVMSYLNEEANLDQELILNNEQLKEQQPCEVVVVHA